MGKRLGDGMIFFADADRRCKIHSSIIRTLACACGIQIVAPLNEPVSPKARGPRPHPRRFLQAPYLPRRENFRILYRVEVRMTMGDFTGDGNLIASASRAVRRRINSVLCQPRTRHSSWYHNSLRGGPASPDVAKTPRRTRA